MKLAKLMMGLAAAALVAAPTLAQNVLAPAVAPLSGDESKLEGEELLILAVGGAAVVAGIVVIASGGDDEPLSP